MTKDLFRNGVILPVLDAPAVPSVPAPLLLVLGLLLLDGESPEVLAELEAARPVQVPSSTFHFYEAFKHF